MRKPKGFKLRDRHKHLLSMVKDNWVKLLLAILCLALIAARRRRPG